MSNSPILGVMSGSSLDGIDLAFCSFQSNEEYTIHCADTIEYPTEIKEDLKKVFQFDLKSYFAFCGRFNAHFANIIKTYIEKNKMKPVMIVSHGHTLFHDPAGLVSVQIGHGGVIAALTGVDTLCDLRIQDIALGGQGAPLAALVDQYLFNQYNIMVNLGGIANVSVRLDNYKIISWDVGPCNQVLNALSARMGLEFDDGGKISSTGNFVHELYDRWQSLNYFDLSPPKSLDNSWVQEYFIGSLSDKYPVEDIIYTSSQFIVDRMEKDLSPWILRMAGTKMMVTGGGAHNHFIMGLLAERMIKYQITIDIKDNQTIDFKEALLMAFMGWRYLTDLTNTISTATGAVKNIVAGGLFKGNG